MIVLVFPELEGIGRKVAEDLGSYFQVIRRKVFPDGESYVRIETNVENKDVILVQTTYPEQDKRLLELFFAVDALRSHGVRNVRVVLTYLAYARQDREFLPGEAVSVRTVLRLLSDAGVDELYVVDLHKPESLRYFAGQARNIIPSKVFSSKLRSMGLKNPIVVSPDLGASHRAKALASELECECFVIRKHRDRITGQIRHELPENIDVDGKEVVIVDDIISTGGTVANIASFLRGCGASEVFAVASHGLFVGEALGKLRNAGVDKVLTLNTLAVRINDDLIEYVDVSPELTAVLREYRAP